MKIFNKLFIASTMVVTLGATASCGNKGNDFITGSPYTYVRLEGLTVNQDNLIKFDCEGTPKVYWEGIEGEASSEKEHIYHPEFDEDSFTSFIIEGNVTSLWFFDENGDALADGNMKITGICFSNTITSIPKKAFANILLDVIYIPESVKKIGQNTFYPYRPSTYFCAAKTRPSGWDKNWCTFEEANKMVSWGVSYHITDDATFYVLYENESLGISGLGYIGNPFDEYATSLEIPETIEINNRSFPVVAVLSISCVDTIESVKFSKNIRYIAKRVFYDCDALKTVSFADEYEYLVFDDDVFCYCDSLETITLPKGTINISYELFGDCDKLTTVKIPSSVKWIDSYAFSGSSRYVNDIDIYVNEYKNAADIAICKDGAFNLDAKEKVTFHYAANLDISDFIKKGWPEANASSTPTIIWAKE